MIINAKALSHLFPTLTTTPLRLEKLLSILRDMRGEEWTSEEIDEGGGGYLITKKSHGKLPNPNKSTSTFPTTMKRAEEILETITRAIDKHQIALNDRNFKTVKIIVRVDRKGELEKPLLSVDFQEE